MMPATDLKGITRTRTASLLSLFTSGSTLICCALPALLVALGAGAALSSVVATVPQLVWFSEQKEVVFGFAGVMLAMSGVLQWQSRSLPCPLDPELARICTRTRRHSLAVYLISLALFLTGGFFAFVAPLFGS
jgi:hypothetical protein